MCKFMKTIEDIFIMNKIIKLVKKYRELRVQLRMHEEWCRDCGTGICIIQDEYKKKIEKLIIYMEDIINAQKAGRKIKKTGNKKGIKRR